MWHRPNNFVPQMRLKADIFVTQMWPRPNNFVPRIGLKPDNFVTQMWPIPINFVPQIGLKSDNFVTQMWPRPNNFVPQMMLKADDIKLRPSQERLTCLDLGRCFGVWCQHSSISSLYWYMTSRPGGNIGRIPPLISSTTWTTANKQTNKHWPDTALNQLHNLDNSK